MWANGESPGPPHSVGPAPPARAAPPPPRSCQLANGERRRARRPGIGGAGTLGAGTARAAAREVRSGRRGGGERAPWATRSSSWPVPRTTSTASSPTSWRCWPSWKVGAGPAAASSPVVREGCLEEGRGAGGARLEPRRRGSPGLPWGRAHPRSCCQPRLLQGRRPCRPPGTPGPRWAGPACRSRRPPLEGAPPLPALRGHLQRTAEAVRGSGSWPATSRGTGPCPPVCPPGSGAQGWGVRLGKSLCSSRLPPQPPGSNGLGWRSSRSWTSGRRKWRSRPFLTPLRGTSPPHRVPRSPLNLGARGVWLGARVFRGLRRRVGGGVCGCADLGSSDGSGR